MRLEIVVFLVLLSIFIFLKYGKGRLPKFRLPEISSLNNGEGVVFPFLFGYILPILLFIAMLVIMWLTNDVLGWWSFFTRDGKTFTALVITYLIFASAFMQEKKKAPFYQKIMVFAMIVAVVVALTGSPSELWEKYEWKGEEQSKSVESFTPKQSSATRTVNIIATQGAFTEVKIPPATDFRWDVQEGCLIAVTHDGDPHGSIYDCTEHIELGTYLHNLRIGFSSKTETPVKIAVKLTPL